MPNRFDSSVSTVESVLSNMRSHSKLECNLLAYLRQCNQVTKNAHLEDVTLAKRWFLLVPVHYCPIRMVLAWIRPQMSTSLKTNDRHGGHCWPSASTHSSMSISSQLTFLFLLSLLSLSTLDCQLLNSAGMGHTWLAMNFNNCTFSY